MTIRDRIRLGDYVIYIGNIQYTKHIPTEGTIYVKWFDEDSGIFFQFKDSNDSMSKFVILESALCGLGTEKERS